MTTTNIATLKADLESVTRALIKGRPVSDILVKRGEVLIESTTQFYNEDLLVLEVIEDVITRLKADPDLHKHDMIVKDGEVHPTLEDGEEADEVIKNFIDYLSTSDPDLSATLAFIIKWTAQSYCTPQKAA